MDRNAYVAGEGEGSARSLSARRAWIEMQTGQRVCPPSLVALRKESVDRNQRKLVNANQDAPGRSPQGERG